MLWSSTRWIQETHELDTFRVILMISFQVLVPGNCNRYLAWGFADQSFRLCAYDTDKVSII